MLVHIQVLLCVVVRPRKYPSGEVRDEQAHLSQNALKNACVLAWRSQCDPFKSDGSPAFIGHGIARKFIRTNWITKEQLQMGDQAEVPLAMMS